MSLTLSATFSNSVAAARAVRLLRQSGIGAQRLSRPAPTAEARLYPFDASGLYAATNTVEFPHTIPLYQEEPPAAEPARCHLSISAEPAEMAAVREIVYRCGGVLL